MTNIMELCKPTPAEEQNMFINQLIHEFNVYKNIYDALPEDDSRRLSYKGLLFAIKDVIYCEHRNLLESLKY